MPVDTRDHLVRALTNGDVAESGHIACIDTATGLLAVGKTSTTLIPIGNFVFTGDSITGDGVTPVKVRLFREGRFHWFDNDADSPLLDADVMGNCYIKDTHTVSKTSTSRSLAGRVWEVGQRGVLVEAGVAVTGPAGAASGSVQSTATRSSLADIAAANRVNGGLVMVRTDGSLWRFISAATVDGDEAGELVIEPAAGTGRWVRADKACVLKIPVAAAMDDNETIFTVPAGFALRLAALPYWEVTTGFTGGTGSALGVNSTKTGYTADGALLGGTGGDVAATLVAGVVPGTIGGGLDSLAELQAALFVEDDEFRVNEITDAFTAGAGFVCVPVVIAAAPVA
jgi:hypothetical protein